MLQKMNSQKEELEPVGEIIRCRLTNCREMLEPGTNWLTRHLLDSEQTCSIRHKMDTSM